MKIIRYISLVVFSFTIISLSSSCKKENTFPPNTTVFGTVTDDCTGLPIEGAQVTLFKSTLSNPHNDRKEIRNVTTNSDGHFEIKFYKDNNYFWINTSKTNYNGVGYSRDHPEDTYLIKTKGDHKINVSLQSQLAKSHLKVHIKNSSPLNNNDSIYITFLNAYSPSSYSHSTNYSVYYIGQTVDVTDDITFFPCPPFQSKFNWMVTKGFISYAYSDSIICPVGAAADYSINY